MPLYPLRFEPIYQYRLWGGRRLASLLSAPLPGDGTIGEAWVRHAHGRQDAGNRDARRSHRLARCPCRHDGKFPEGTPRRRPQDRLRQGRGETRRQAKEACRRQGKKDGSSQCKAGTTHQGRRRRVASEPHFRSLHSPNSASVLAHDLVRKPVPIPDRGRGHAFRDHAHGAGKSILNKPPKRTPSLPSKADILAFIGKRPGKVGTREIARAFGLKNAMRAELKRMLRDLASDGAVEKRHKKLHHAGTLPSTVLADVTARDADGELLATPDEWDEEAHGPAPKMRIPAQRKARPHEAAGIGDRVLLHVEETEEDSGIRHRGRVIKIIDHPKHRVLGIFRNTPNGGGRLEPVDKKMLGKEISIPAGATRPAEA